MIDVFPEGSPSRFRKCVCKLLFLPIAYASTLWKGFFPGVNKADENLYDNSDVAYSVYAGPRACANL